MRDRRYVEDLTLDEIEQVLYVRRREERQDRLRRIGKAQRLPAAVVTDEGSLAPALPGALASTAQPRPKTRLQVWRERILIGIEGAALIGLVAVLTRM